MKKKKKEKNFVDIYVNELLTLKRDGPGAFPQTGLKGLQKASHFRDASVWGLSWVSTLEKAELNPAISWLDER